MWIARDKDGRLYMFTKKPFRYEYDSAPWVDTDGVEHKTRIVYEGGKKCKRYSLDRNMYPDVTFENSPKELVLRELAEEYGDLCYIRGYCDANRFEYGKEECGNITFDEYVGSKR